MLYYSNKRKKNNRSLSIQPALALDNMSDMSYNSVSMQGNQERINKYDHLNDDKDYPQREVNVSLSFDALALLVLKTNYGLRRFISAANRAVHDPRNNLADEREDVERIVEALELLYHQRQHH